LICYIVGVAIISRNAPAMPSTKPSSPQLDQRRRERGEAALDIAVMALRRIERLGSAAELARKALTQIETLVPEQAQRR
jgi:hypothetical protein